MYNLLRELLSDRKGDIIFKCFGLIHILYIILTFGGIVLTIFLLKNKSDKTKQKVISLTINIVFILYILDFFLMPFAYGEIDLEKLPFHICTSMCVMCFLSRHNKFLSKFKTQFILLGLVGNIIYVIYPAGVGWYQISPFTYRVIQTLSYHSLMTAFCIYSLAFDDIKLKWKNIYKELLMIIALVIWSLIGNYLYQGAVDNYLFNWFFTVQDPFGMFDLNISSIIMPFVMTFVIFIVVVLIYLMYFFIKKIANKNNIIQE